HLSISGAAGWEGTAGSTFFTFTVSLRFAYDQAFTVAFATADGTAVAGEDYVVTAGTLNFGLNDVYKTITVEVFGDVTLEDTEEFSVVLSGAPSYAVLVNQSAAGTIYDGDQPPDDGGGYWDPGYDWWYYYGYYY